MRGTAPAAPPANRLPVAEREHAADVNRSHRLHSWTSVDFFGHQWVCLARLDAIHSRRCHSCSLDDSLGHRQVLLARPDAIRSRCRHSCSPDDSLGHRQVLLARPDAIRSRCRHSCSPDDSLGHRQVLLARPDAIHSRCRHSCSPDDSLGHRRVFLVRTVVRRALLAAYPKGAASAGAACSSARRPHSPAAQCAVPRGPVAGVSAARMVLRRLLRPGAG